MRAAAVIILALTLSGTALAQSPGGGGSGSRSGSGGGASAGSVGSTGSAGAGSGLTSNPSAPASSGPGSSVTNPSAPSSAASASHGLNPSGSPGVRSPTTSGATTGAPALPTSGAPQWYEPLYETVDTKETPNQPAITGRVPAARRVTSGSLNHPAPRLRAIGSTRLSPTGQAKAQRTEQAGRPKVSRRAHLGGGRVVNKQSRRSLVVRVNDRIAAQAKGSMDLSRASARAIEITGVGSVALHRRNGASAYQHIQPKRPPALPIAIRRDQSVKTTGPVPARPWRGPLRSASTPAAPFVLPEALRPSDLW